LVIHHDCCWINNDANYGYTTTQKIEVNNAVTAKSTSDKSLGRLLPFSKETNWFGFGFHLLD
jgi:hypothetical protein